MPVFHGLVTWCVVCGDLELPACLQTNSEIKTGCLCLGEGPLPKTFSGNGNICRQCLQERSSCVRKLAEETCWPALMLAGMDTDSTPASFGLALVTAHPHSPTKACVTWGECALFVFLLRSVLICKSYHSTSWENALQSQECFHGKRTLKNIQKTHQDLVFL